MELSELNEYEACALVGLAREIIKADKELSADEEAYIEGLADKLGEEVFYKAVERSKRVFKTKEGLDALMNAVDRPQARAVIWLELRSLAGSDDFERKEAQILAWIAKTWDIELS